MVAPAYVGDDLAHQRDQLRWFGGMVGNHVVDMVNRYGEDRDNGRPVKVRYTWTKVDRDHARWEQAFSYDDRSWETNWRADFVRADPAKTCEAGRPKRT